MNLTYWLRKSPQPATILADDKRIDVPQNGRAWRDLTATIQALEPTKLVALDKKGDVIRSVILESESGDEKSSASPEMSDLQLFAKLLAEGYQHGMKVSQPVIDSSMAFVERLSQRLAKTESEVERLRAHIHRQNMQIAELSNQPPPAADDGGLVGALMTGVLQGQQLQQQNANAAAVTPIKGGTKK